MQTSLRVIDEPTLLQALRLGIASGAERMHFRVGCLPLCCWRSEQQQIRYRQLTGEDTEAIAGMLLARAHVPAQVQDDPCDAAHPLAMFCELPGEALLQVKLAREQGQLAVDVGIALPWPEETVVENA